MRRPQHPRATFPARVHRTVFERMMAKYPNWDMGDEYRRFVERKEAEENEWMQYDQSRKTKP
jgi:hypothetical protein